MTLENWVMGYLSESVCLETSQNYATELSKKVGRGKKRLSL